MPKTTIDNEMTADQAKDELGVTSRAAVIYMIKTDKLPGARKLEPGKRTSPWMIPIKAVQSLKKKRAQADPV